MDFKKIGYEKVIWIKLVQYSPAKKFCEHSDKYSDAINAVK